MPTGLHPHRHTSPAAALIYRSRRFDSSLLEPLLPSNGGETISHMSTVVRLDRDRWNGPGSGGVAPDAALALEAGDVLFMPALHFAVDAGETVVFTPAILGSSKNASY